MKKSIAALYTYHHNIFSDYLIVGYVTKCEAVLTQYFLSPGLESNCVSKLTRNYHKLKLNNTLDLIQYIIAPIT